MQGKLPAPAPRRFVSLTIPSSAVITPDMRTILRDLYRAGNGVTVGFDAFARIVNAAAETSPAMRDAALNVCDVFGVRVNA